MVVLDQFYQIIEKRTSRVSSVWKVTHTLICVCGAICGFLTAFCFGRILSDFNYNCVLNADVVFENATFINSTRLPKLVHAIDLTMTTWGPTGECDFAQFTPLVFMISAVIWGVYFAVLSKGGAGYRTDLLGKPWGYIYPCIFFTTILFIVFVISVVHLKRGMLAFCNEFHSEFNNTGCINEINVYTEQFNPDRNVLFYDFYPNWRVAVVAANVGIWAWVAQLILCLFRVFFFIDFDLQLVTIMEKEEEEVEKVIEFNVLRDIDEASEVSEV